MAYLKLQYIDRQIERQIEDIHAAGEYVLSPALAVLSNPSNQGTESDADVNPEIKLIEVGKLRLYSKDSLRFVFKGWAEATQSDCGADLDIDIIQ